MVIDKLFEFLKSWNYTHLEKREPTGNTTAYWKHESLPETRDYKPTGNTKAYRKQETTRNTKAYWKQKTLLETRQPTENTRVKLISSNNKLNRNSFKIYLSDTKD
jgi:hypothetical protein